MGGRQYNPAWANSGQGPAMNGPAGDYTQTRARRLACTGTCLVMVTGLS